jgi:hypothetical protein
MHIKPLFHTFHVINNFCHHHIERNLATCRTVNVRRNVDLFQLVKSPLNTLLASCLELYKMPKQSLKERKINPMHYTQYRVWFFACNIHIQS